jgi:hypothetical protein
MSAVKSLFFRQLGGAGLKSATRFVQPKRMATVHAKAFSTYYLQTHEYIIVIFVV